MALAIGCRHIKPHPGSLACDGLVAGAVRIAGALGDDADDGRFGVPLVAELRQAYVHVGVAGAERDKGHDPTSGLRVEEQRVLVVIESVGLVVDGASDLQSRRPRRPKRQPKSSVHMGTETSFLPKIVATKRKTATGSSSVATIFGRNEI